MFSVEYLVINRNHWGWYDGAVDGVWQKDIWMVDDKSEFLSHVGDHSQVEQIWQNTGV